MKTNESFSGQLVWDIIWKICTKILNQIVLCFKIIIITISFTVIRPKIYLISVAVLCKD
jgi:hypothetical protein